MKNENDKGFSGSPISSMPAGANIEDLGVASDGAELIKYPDGLVVFMVKNDD